jgi:hypothetical protein
MDDGTHNFSAINIDGGTLDGVTIGGSTPGAGTFNGLTGTGNILGPAWHVTMGGSTQNITAGNFATVEFDSEVLDSNSNFNTGTFKMIPTVEGWYFCTAGVTFTAAWNVNKLISLQIIATTGDSYASFKETIGTEVDALMVYDLVYCNGSTDEIYVQVSNGDSTTRTINQNATDTWFLGWRIQ